MFYRTVLENNTVGEKLISKQEWKIRYHTIGTTSDHCGVYGQPMQETTVLEYYYDLGTDIVFPRYYEYRINPPPL
jgi:hypothetical protein